MLLRVQDIPVPHSSSLGLDMKAHALLKYFTFMGIPGRRV